VFDVTYFAFIILDGYFQAIPYTSVGSDGIRDEIYLSDSTGAGIEIDRYFVFKISLGFIEGVIVVEILIVGHIGIGFQGTSLGSLGIALIVIGLKEPTQYIIIIFREGSERNEIVVGRVVFNFCPGLGVQGLDSGQILCEKSSFTLIRQSVIPHILPFSIVWIWIKRSGNVSYPGYNTQVGGIQGSTGTGNGESVFKEHPSILDDIFGDIPQVDVHFTTALKDGPIGLFHKWIEHPHLYVFHVGCFKIIALEGSHNTPPPRFRSDQIAIRVEPRTVLRSIGDIVVVWSPFGGIIHHIKGEKSRCKLQIDFPIRKDLVDRYCPGIRIAIVSI